MDNDKQPHIGILIDSSFPDIMIEKYQQELYHPSLEIDIKKADVGGPYSSLEWAIPTAIGLYILKPFFDSFSKEAEKIFLKALKNG